MSITSLSYVVFILAVGVVYFAFQKTDWQKYVLLLANIFFINIACGKKAMFIIAAIVVAVYAVARLMETTEDKNIRKKWLIPGFIVTIGILIYFKYFKATYGILLGVLSGNDPNLYHLITPVGISYYSLALFAYLTDVSHKKCKAEKNLLDFAAYVTYFPSIVEGPINMFRKTMPQIKARHAFEWDRLVEGFQRILWGYFKKLVVGDRIGTVVNAILPDANAHGYQVAVAIILYSFQIYADFSGGIDVIMGVSHVLGIDLEENFKAPLISMNVTEYWQRWHKSLGEFMEKYIYYPIVLNRSLLKFSKKIKHPYYRKAFTAILASFLVFIVVGIWHGTGWNYVVYGLYQATFTSTAVAFAPTYKAIKGRLKIDEKCLSWRLFCIIRTFIILTFGRALIKSASVGQALALFKRLFQFDNLYTLFDGNLLTWGLDYSNFLLMIIGILLMILVDVLNEHGIIVRKWVGEQDIIFRYFVYLVALFAILILGAYGQGFDAASFIYQGF